MDYSRTTLSDRLSAEYVLGTLRGGARRRFETLLLAHPRLREGVADWQRRLQVLEPELTLGATPSDRVWQQVQLRLFGAASERERGNGGASAFLRWWQGLAAVSTAIALTLVLWVMRPLEPVPPVVVVLGSQSVSGHPELQPTAFVASVSGDGHSLVIRPMPGSTWDAVHHAMELWAIPAQGHPRSLGVVQLNQVTTVLRTHLLDNTAAFGVTVEPPGGSPSGHPTGPLVSVGKLQT